MKSMDCWAGAPAAARSVRAFVVRLVRPKVAANIFLAACLCYIIANNKSQGPEDLPDENAIIPELEGGITNHRYQTGQVMEEEPAGPAPAPAPPAEPSAPKKILFWTGYYNRKDMVFGFGKEPFIQAGCRVTSCWATDDRSQLNQSDAIIFHGGNYNASDLPSHRFPHQRYIFYLFETLPHGRYLPYFSSLTDNYFNWTMTHRRDSDVYIAEPYGAMVRKPGSLPLQQLPPKLPPGVRPPLPSELMVYPSKKVNKTRMVAWFCSNTRTHGRRELYIKELSRHIHIDIYGKCGNLTCEPHNSPKCNNMLNEYKFYLSAENSLCADYVTEKFYRALQAGVVPIVYGGADYTQYAPPHSFISVADFASPKDLADYLLLLDRNDAMYLRYFEWRKEWEVLRRPLSGWCDLCEKLNGPNQEVKIYESMAKWWFDELPCLPGSVFLESVLGSKVV